MNQTQPNVDLKQKKLNGNTTLMECQHLICIMTQVM